MIIISSSLSGQGPIIPPASPEIDRVTIDSVSGLPVIHWKASTSTDVEEYTTYHFITDSYGQWYPVPTTDTVDGDTREYTYLRLSPPDDSISLTVAAIDSSGTPSPFSPPHTTMHLTTAYDSCTRTMTLDWTPYLGWTSVVRYEIYVSIDNGAFSLIKEESGDVLTTDQNFIEKNRRYCYFVQAVRNDNQRSLSNITCRDVRHAIPPGYIDIEYASVDTTGANMIDLAFYIDPSGEVNDFQLFRARPGTPFAGQQVFSDVTGNQFTYTDQVIGTDRRYLYMLYSLDVCNNPEIASDTAGNIVLDAYANGLQSILQWNAYEEYEAGVKNYHVYRITNQQQKDLIISLDARDTSFTDDLGLVTGATIQDQVCYYIVAEENDNYTLGDKGFSYSNTVCISVVPEILMPNAFTPNNDGRNDEIKPVLTFIPEQYIFKVFDRWGSLVFETTDPLAAWDGKIKGRARAPEGVYIYYIRLTTASGIEVEQKGQITVFYP
jgi:gliding motility-associated-like protein